MAPDFWTAFVFFGIPLVVGLLGVASGVRRCFRAYRQYAMPDPDLADENVGPERPDGDLRGNLLRGVPLLVGGALLAVHSTRWLLRIL